MLRWRNRSAQDSYKVKVVGSSPALSTFSRAGGFQATVPSENEWLQTSYKNRPPIQFLIICEIDKISTGCSSCKIMFLVPGLWVCFGVDA